VGRNAGAGSRSILNMSTGTAEVFSLQIVHDGSEKCAACAMLHQNSDRSVTRTRKKTCQMSAQLQRAMSLFWAYYYFRFVLFNFSGRKTAVIYYSYFMDLIETPKEDGHIIIFNIVRLLVTMPCYCEFIKGKDYILCAFDRPAAIFQIFRQPGLWAAVSIGGCPRMHRISQGDKRPFYREQASLCES
jgi:hypothetical protein